MKTFKINMDNYNIDKPELEFGCFTDKQIRLMIALVESNLRDIKDHIANVDQQIEDIDAKLISLKKSYEENSYLYDFSQERQLKKGKKSLQGTRINFTLNRDQIVSLLKQLDDLKTFILLEDQDVTERYYATSAFI
tara:strand:+ start:358 stop:765 length:408 start_codon:yes stop_codon:yes gene_type:complete